MSIGSNPKAGGELRSPVHSPEWLKGGGQMGDAIRAFDWSGTPLGPRAAWPPALRIAVTLCLNSRFPMFLWWGSHLVNLYNDAYIPILGKRHTHALGALAPELWNYMWPVLAAQVDAVFEKGEASWQERLLLVTNRNGSPEEAWFTYSHSPVFDEAGDVAGLICVVSEETTHVRAEEELRRSEEFNRRVLESSSDCIKVLDLDGSIRMMSEGGQRAFGVTDVSQLLGRNWIELWEGADREAAQRVVELARQGQAGSFEGFCPTFTGEARWWSVVLSPMLNARGEAERLICISRDVTARRQADEALRDSQRRLERVLETDAVGVLFFDQTGTVINANDVFLRMTGYTREELERRELTWRRMTPSEWVPVSEEQMEKFTATGRIGPYEKEYLCKDGRRRWMLFAGRDLGDGTISEYCIDISGQKRTEEALRSSEAKYRSLFESIDEGFCIIEVLFDSDEHPYDYRILEANSAFEKHTGLTNAVGRTARELVPGHETHWFETYGDVARTGNPARFANRAEALGRFYEVYAFRIDSPEQRHVAVLFNDISERERMAQALRASEERLQQVFTQAPVAVALLRGRDLVFELANPMYREFLPDRELLGNPLAAVMPEISQELLSILQRVQETGEPFVAHEYLAPLVRGGVLEDHWFTFVYHPWRQLDGTVVGVVVVAVDVTSHVRDRLELERVNRELEEFAYVASHDLQEPLRMVNIYSHLLLRRFGTGAPEPEQYREFIRQGVARMEALIKDLLTYSRTVQRDEAPVGSADLAAALNEALSVLQNRIDETDAAITAEMLPVVRGDTKQFAHVFQNLLSNALKYRKRDAPPEVHVSARRDGAQWVIAVRDNGIGFDQKHADRIFGLFKRLHKDEYPGTGLGLAICMRIVERYGGRMWAQGRSGEGATLFFALPVAEE